MAFSSGQSCAKNIAGELALSEDFSASMKSWRIIFSLNQSELAKRLSISPSVISDYESGRRNSPGISFIKRFVNALISSDLERGGQTITKYGSNVSSDAILAMDEFIDPMTIGKFCYLIDAEFVYNKELAEKRQIRGYTVIDSIQTILNFSEREFSSIYGSSTERALIFTKVSLGRSPLIAIKVTQPKPGIIILHGLGVSDVDPLALNIAKMMNIPLAVTQLNEQEMIDKLRRNLT